MVNLDYYFSVNAFKLKKQLKTKKVVTVKKVALSNNCVLLKPTHWSKSKQSAIHRNKVLSDSE